MKTVQSTGSTTCRDCGYLLKITARGCPRCAMNVEAERMIERFIWQRVVPGAIMVAIFAALGLILWLR